MTLDQFSNRSVLLAFESKRIKNLYIEKLLKDFNLN